MNGWIHSTYSTLHISMVCAHHRSAKCTCDLLRKNIFGIIYAERETCLLRIESTTTCLPFFWINETNERMNKQKTDFPVWISFLCGDDDQLRRRPRCIIAVISIEKQTFAVAVGIVLLILCTFDPQPIYRVHAVFTIHSIARQCVCVRGRWPCQIYYWLMYGAIQNNTPQKPTDRIVYTKVE